MDIVQRTQPSAAHRLALLIARYRFVLAVTFGLMVVTSIPTMFGYLVTPSDKWFSGINYNVHDTAQYFSWMRESGDRVFIENKLTSEPNNAIFLNLHWWIPGRLAALLGLSLPAVYHLYRLVSIPLLVFSVYAFTGILFTDQTRRNFAFLLTLFTSGMGWIWVVAKQFTGELAFPTDVYTTPGNSFYIMTVSPPQAFATALTLGVLLLALLSVLRDRLVYAVASGVLALFLGMGHIYDLVTVWAVLGVFGVLLVLRSGWSWKLFSYLSLVVVMSAPAALYFGWVSSSANPMWQQALSQYDNLEVFTPDPVHLLILLGLTFWVALLSFNGIVPLSRQSDKGLFIKGWFMVTLVLIYMPFHFRIMLLTGYQLPMAVLATSALFDRIMPWLRQRLSRVRRFRLERLVRWAPALFLLAVLPTNLYLYAWRIFDLNRQTYPYYLYKSDVLAFEWLEENANPDDVVLSSFITGHYLPGLTGARAFLSNAVMTMDFNRKYEQVKQFYSAGASDEWRLQYLRDENIRFILHGPAERSVGDYSPAEANYLRLVFETQETKVYELVSYRLFASPSLQAHRSELSAAEAR